jgi:hypothetical protein
VSGRREAAECCHHGGINCQVFDFNHIFLLSS